MRSRRAIYPDALRVKYVYGQKPPQKGLLRHNLGWFGDIAGLALAIGFFVFFFTMRDSMMTTVALFYNGQADIPRSQSKIAPDARERVVENAVNMQPVISDWARLYPEQKWSIMVKSIDGPTFQASYQPDLTFTSSGVAKSMIVKLVSEQVPYAKQGREMVQAGKTKKSVTTCVDLMLRQNDSDCTNALIALLQQDKIDTFFSQAGYKRTSFDKTSGVHKTSVTDMAEYLRGLYGSFFEPKEKQKIIASLQAQVTHNGLTKSCPGCTFIDVSGSAIGGLQNAAIVQYSRGSYVVVVQSDKGTTAQAALLEGKIHQRINESL